MKFLKAAALVVVSPIMLSACQTGGGEASDDSADDARFVTQLQALYPGDKDASADYFRGQADDLCDMLEASGSFEAWSKDVTLAASMAGKTEDLETYETMSTTYKAMPIAMEWRCPEFYDDAQDYIATFE